MVEINGQPFFLPIWNTAPCDPHKIVYFCRYEEEYEKAVAGVLSGKFSPV